MGGRPPARNLQRLSRKCRGGDYRCPGWLLSQNAEKRIYRPVTVPSYESVLEDKRHTP
ncbi:MAG: hypothetical protein ACLUS6_03785 [Dysosmobacter sp.]